MLLNILVPTYNRPVALRKNLSMLDRYISEKKCAEDVKVIVSDNGSSSDEESENRVAVQSFHNSIEYHHHQDNMGYEKNILFLLSKSVSEYVMYLGDDDYLSFDLFSLIVDYIRTGNYSCIVCNFFLVDEQGKRIAAGCRDLIQKDREYNRNDMIFALKGHQLSCLTFRTEGVLDFYRHHCKSNQYPTITFIGYSMSCGNGLHITRFPYANTQINKKNFDYSFDGLLEDACKCYECLPFCSKEYRVEAYKQFLIEDRDRFVNRQTFIHPFRFIKKVYREYDVSNLMRKMIVRKFIPEWIKLPFRYCYDMFERKVIKRH